MSPRSQAFVVPLLVAGIASFAVAAAFSACGMAQAEAEFLDEFALGDVGGGNTRVIHLPTSPEQSLQCVQGAFGSYSHGLSSTKYDIDLDTSNTMDEAIYAASSGIARVHTSDPDRNFGNHVNIDRGDGTYVCEAHLSTIIVHDGEEVAEGQLIGYEGCTGSCSGDHIHVGLHEGDAKRPAEFGKSVSVDYFIADAGAPRGYTTLSSEQFVCGIRSMGDDDNGLFYTSALKTVLYHPNGSLVKTSHDPRVYRIDGQLLRWIVDENMFRSRGYNFNDVATISEDEFSCYGIGSLIDTAGHQDAVYDKNGQLWLVVGQLNDPDRYRIRVDEMSWVEVLLSYGLDFTMEQPEWVDDTHAYMNAYHARPGHAFVRNGTVVRERSRSDLYFVSDTVAMPIADWQTYLLLGFGARHSVLFIEDGTLNSLTSAIGNCQSGLWCLDRNTVSACAGAFSGQAQAGEFAPGRPIEQAPSAPSSPVVPIQHASAPSQPAPAPAQPSQPAPEQPQPTPAQSQPPPQAPAPSPAPQPASAPVPFAQAAACNTPACIDGSTLLLSDTMWQDPNINGVAAYFWGYGDCFVSYPESHLFFESADGYYQMDFSRVGHACESQFTIISTRGTDGEIPDEFMSNWSWYNYEPMCRTGSELCNLLNDGVPWEQWWLSVAYDPATGLRANGNGFTSRSQLF